jgi:hypothetical protein
MENFVAPNEVDDDTVDDVVAAIAEAGGALRSVTLEHTGLTCDGVALIIGALATAGGVQRLQLEGT